MNQPRRILLNFFIGVVTCLLLIGISSTPSFSNPIADELNPNASAPTLTSSPSTLTASAIDSQLTAILQEADSVLMAQGTSASPMTRYVAVMTKNNVIAPSAPSTSAFGAAGAVLVGDRLIVRGNFSNLSSTLRDYATDPLDPPNPNITSGIHVHQGAAAANGPFQYALEVSPDESELGGRFAGEYTLTSEQLQALSNGELYVDLHTKQNRAGELRGIFQPY